MKKKPDVLQVRVDILTGLHNNEVDLVFPGPISDRTFTVKNLPKADEWQLISRYGVPFLREIFESWNSPAGIDEVEEIMVRRTYLRIMRSDGKFYPWPPILQSFHEAIEHVVGVGQVEFVTWKPKKGKKGKKGKGKFVPYKLPHKVSERKFLQIVNSSCDPGILEGEILSRERV